MSMSGADSPPYPLRWQRAALAIGLSALAAMAGARLVVEMAPVSSMFPAKAAVVPAILGVLLTPMASAHPWPTLGPANRLTLARAALVGVMAAWLGEAWAPGLLLGALGGLAFFLDGCDGWLARRTGRASPFGARLDMELDAVTVLVLSVLAWQIGHAGLWVILSGAMRYLFVGASWIWPWLDRPLPPAPRRAWICGAQITLLCACLVPWPVAGLSALLAAVGLALLTWSFAVDTLWLVRNRP